MVAGDNGIGTDNKGALDNIFQLAHIAWPVMGNKARHRFRADIGDLLVE